MRKELTAVKAFPYAGRRLRAGDEFEARESDARLLIAIGKARYRTRAVTPAVTKDTVAKRATPENPPVADKAPGTYVPPVRGFKRA